ncbi:Molybdenum cofactor guanylyltransferase [Thiorhodovibrio winogradskyi]|uniref:Molybdenum cofactor guanylyltransferase n=2 Tax=Thiorhodovibrio winogradskyi TaxID=77007 RepID=A0ABZ0SGJ5_9GAMM
MDYQGQPLVHWVIERLKPQVGTVLISANRCVPEYHRFGWPLLFDDIPDHAGPLAGLSRGLECSRTPWILMVPCDGPYVPFNLAIRLANTIETEKVPAAVASDGHQTHFTYAMLSRSLLEDLQAYLASGERRLGAWLNRHSTAVADFSDNRLAFINLNTTEDFKQANSINQSKPGAPMCFPSSKELLL